MKKQEKDSFEFFAIFQAVLKDVLAQGFNRTFHK